MVSDWHAAARKQTALGWLPPPSTYTQASALLQKLDSVTKLVQATSGGRKPMS